MSWLQGPSQEKLQDNLVEILNYAETPKDWLLELLDPSPEHSLTLKIRPKISQRTNSTEEELAERLLSLLKAEGLV